jgi:2-aminoadipate transaminase
MHAAVAAVGENGGKAVMSDSEFAYTNLYARDLPPPTPRWGGFPPYYFVGGNNDPTMIPTEALAEAAASVLRREAASLAIYNLGHGPQGYPPLRDFVADKLALRREIKCTRDDIIITSGSGQGIDMVCRLLTERGDTIIVEGYSYGGAITKFRKMGLNIVGVPLDDGGIRMDALDEILGGLKARGIAPKFIYTIPTIQNPTGSILPLDRRHRLLALAAQYGVPIFEDECYSDLIWAWDAPPALYALDPAQVIHIGSFSKSLAPALRVGYVVAQPAVLAQLQAVKGDSGTGAVDQMVIAEYFSRFYSAHVQKLTETLGEKLDEMVEALEREFGTAVEMWKPVGGIFLWFKLPDQVDVRKLVKPAADAGIVFNPGPEWACDGEAAKSYMRLCFAMPSKQVIRDGVAALAKVCFEQTGIPQRSDNVVNARRG